MFTRLTIRTICVLLLSLGHVHAQPPCPCEDAAQQGEQQAPQQEVETEETTTIKICPCYPCGFYPGYCVWYAIRCGDGPTSINLPCNHGSGSCSDATFTNCVDVIVTVSKNVAAKTKPPVKLDSKPKYDADPMLVLFAKKEKHYLVEIPYDATDPSKVIYARIDRVKVPSIETEDHILSAHELMHGHEIDETGYTGNWDSVKNIRIVGDNELLVEFKGRDVYIVTFTDVD